MEGQRRLFETESFCTKRGRKNAERRFRAHPRPDSLIRRKIPELLRKIWNAEFRSDANAQPLPQTRRKNRRRGRESSFALRQPREETPLSSTHLTKKFEQVRNRQLQLVKQSRRINCTFRKSVGQIIKRDRGVERVVSGQSDRSLGDEALLVQSLDVEIEDLQDFKDVLMSKRSGRSR